MREDALGEIVRTINHVEMCTTGYRSLESLEVLFEVLSQPRISDRREVPRDQTVRQPLGSQRNDLAVERIRLNASDSPQLGEAR